MAEEVKRRLLSKVVYSGDGECWIHTGKDNPNGYSRIRVNNKKYLVHRLSYTLYKGEIPEGLFVLHTCDNRKCCNPDHLFLGNNNDNIQDAKRKGRLRSWFSGLNADERSKLRRTWETYNQYKRRS